MTGVDEEVRQLRSDCSCSNLNWLRWLEGQLNATVSGMPCVEREAILADFLKLGVTLEEVLYGMFHR